MAAGWPIEFQGFPHWTCWLYTITIFNYQRVSWFIMIYYLGKKHGIWGDIWWDVTNQLDMILLNSWQRWFNHQFDGTLTRNKACKYWHLTNSMMFWRVWKWGMGPQMQLIWGRLVDHMFKQTQMNFLFRPEMLRDGPMLRSISFNSEIYLVARCPYFRLPLVDHLHRTRGPWQTQHLLATISFRMARFYAPTTIFFDEIDACATAPGLWSLWELTEEYPGYKDLQRPKVSFFNN